MADRRREEENESGGWLEAVCDVFFAICEFFGALLESAS